MTAGYVWRGATFEALRRAVATTADRWPDYAAFAALQERGLRQDALARLRGFASGLAGQTHDTRWAFVQWLFDAHDFATEIVFEALVPFPLRAVLIDTLQTERAKGTAFAFLILARHFAQDAAPRQPDTDAVEALLREGLAHHPKDLPLRISLSAHLLGIVQFHGHHWFESRYLGIPSADLRRLAEAESVLEGIEPTPLRAAIQQTRALLHAWCAFTDAGASDFPAWCRAQGLEAPEGTAVYYQP